MNLIARSLEPKASLAALAAEAVFAAKVYIVAAIIGGAVTIGAVRLGYPLFGTMQMPTQDPSPVQTKPIPVTKPPAALPEIKRDAPNEIVVARSGPPADAKKFVPENPSYVVGAKVFDKNHFVGRVTQISSAPFYVGVPPELKGYKYYVTTKNDDGSTQMIEYGDIEWRGPSAKGEAEWGVLLAGGQPNGQ